MESLCLSVFLVWLSLHDQIQVKHFAQEDLTWGELNTGDAVLTASLQEVSTPFQVGSTSGSADLIA